MLSLPEPRLGVKNTYFIIDSGRIKKNVHYNIGEFIWIILIRICQLHFL